jgi:hypothetical protein
VLLRLLPQAALALAGALMAQLLPGTAVQAAPSLQALEAALNDPAPTALAAVLEPGDGLDPVELEQRRAALRPRVPAGRGRVQPGATLRDGRPSVEVLVTGSDSQGAVRFRLEARQLLWLGGGGARFNRQEVLRESAVLRSGADDLRLSLQIPDAVLTGQRYDLDVVFDDPLDGGVVAGAIKPVSASELLQFRSPDLPLEALGGGGLFKSVQAPYQPGSQTWAVLLVHPKGVVAASKRVRVVADRQGLQL